MSLSYQGTLLSSQFYVNSHGSQWLLLCRNVLNMEILGKPIILENFPEQTLV